MKTSEEIEKELDEKLLEIEDLEQRLEDIEYLLDTKRNEYRTLEAEYSDTIEEEVSAIDE
ncbi:hypothetical protein [Bacillus sonorensis]|uniref:hypothetical protein n=1 Tax=Bacillus sonorensis TaxID=119858 RepID=UPI00098AD067|nr:hypothetical protein [Bacillus sonorensis]